MKILLTAFEPFGGETVNPSLEAAKDVPGRIGEAGIVLRTVPVTFAGAADAVIRAARTERPDAVLCLGQAGGRAALTPERVAINLDDARIPDNAGACPKEQPIDPDGPAAYFSRLPVRAMAERIRSAGVPAEVSCTAGTFVCNHLMYALLRWIDTEAPELAGGFMHVPYLDEQTKGRPGVPSLPREEITRGIAAALEAIAESLAVRKGR